MNRCASFVRFVHICIDDDYRRHDNVMVDSAEQERTLTEGKRKIKET